MATADLIEARKNGSLAVVRIIWPVTEKKTRCEEEIDLLKVAKWIFCL